MIRVDIAEIEKLTDILIKMASDAEDALSKIRQISNEMNNDVELSIYPQTPVTLEAVSAAVESLNRGNDTLQTLKNAILPVADTYKETEQKHKNALARMTAAMDTASVGLCAAISSTGIMPVEHSDSVISQGNIEELVSGSVQEMQLANIAAVTKLAKEEYEVSAVVDLLEDD